MKIIAYVSSVTDDAPAAYRAAAHILLDGKQGMHPVIFFGPDKHSVRAKAQAWWDAELAKVVAREAANASRIEAMRTARAARAKPTETDALADVCRLAERLNTAGAGA